MKKKTKKELDWYKGPLSKKRIAELRRKLAIARGFISHLQTVLQGIQLPENMTLSTRGGEFKLDTEALKALLNETSDP